jgi:hypothetical protein
MESITEKGMNVQPAKSRKINRKPDFEGTFLKEAKIRDRRQMYINGEFYDSHAKS